MTKLTQKDWLNFWKYFQDEPHQQDAVRMLYEQMPTSLLEDDSSWVVEYRSGPEDTGLPALTPEAPYTQLVTPSFAYGELTLNEPARRFTSIGQCEIATELCEFLERGRKEFGPLKITSGHRPPAVNAAVGGAANSEHLYQQGCGAVDVYPTNGRGKEFENWVDKNWPFSVGYGMDYRGFVHIGIRSGRPRVRWDY